MTLNTMFEAFRVLILDIDENIRILSRLWLEDQPLALQRVTHRINVLIMVDSCFFIYILLSF